MPKYTSDIIAGYTLYYTTKCIIEAMHVHASDSTLTEETSAKLFVKSNGDTVIQNWGTVNKHDMAKIQKYIKANHEQMYKVWRKRSENGYYGSSTNK